MISRFSLTVSDVTSEIASLIKTNELLIGFKISWEVDATNILLNLCSISAVILSRYETSSKTKIW